MKMQPTFIELPSAPMQNIYRTIQQVAESNLSFFIMGETGVGKEGVAQYIHKTGPYRDKPFMAINCGRFTPELLQSELFGHEKGAFTGADTQRKGAFERVNGGILFLDEVTEMPLDAQKLLLRVLDTKTFTRLGGNAHLITDFQVIAATNRDIGEAVLKTEFRPDLYYRLMGMMLKVPPLQERPEDIAPLVVAFGEFSPKHGKGVIEITSEALTRLEQAAWPGNIRQLRSTVRTAVALATTHTLEVKDFPYNFFTAPGLEKPVSDPERSEGPSTHPELVGILLSLWKTLPAEVQQAITDELSTHLSELDGHSRVPDSRTTEGNSELLDTKDMNQNQILCAVAQKRIEKYNSLSQAARSLGIDTRTLQKHARWNEESAAAK